MDERVELNNLRTLQEYLSNKLIKLEERKRLIEEGEGECDEEEEGEESDGSRPPTNSDETDSDDEWDEFVEDLPPAIKAPPKFRKSVSAETYGLYNKKGYFNARTVVKSADTKLKIRERILKSFMFNSLDEKDLTVVIDAMEEKTFNRNDSVIEQGEDGDELFVVGEGKLHWYKSEKGETNLIRTYTVGDYFGELALLYNAPRAATIKACKNNVVLYSLDRLTFNHIVKDAAIKRREKYEDILRKVKVLDSIDKVERDKLIDSIAEVKFKANDYIIKQGEHGNKFYFIMEGKARAEKVIKNQPPIKVKDYDIGDYFGEVSLLKDQPRAASVIAVTDVSTLFMDRKMFDRILGPLKDILKRNMKLYVHFDNTEE